MRAPAWRYFHRRGLTTTGDTTRGCVASAVPRRWTISTSSSGSGKATQTILPAIIEETLAAGHAKSRENHRNDAGALCGHLAYGAKPPTIRRSPRGALCELADALFDPVRLMGSGFKISHGRRRLDTARPALGTHTAATADRPCSNIKMEISNN